MSGVRRRTWLEGRPETDRPAVHACTSGSRACRIEPRPVSDAGHGQVLGTETWLGWRTSLPNGYSSVNRGKEVVRLDRFQYGQWRYQRVEACPRDLRGIV